MVLSLEHPLRELRVGGTTRAVAAFGAMVSLPAKDRAILAVRMRVYDVLRSVHLFRLRFWHSHEKTIDINAGLVEDGDRNVRATVLNVLCSLAF